MTYHVALEKSTAQTYTATVLGWPDCTGTGKTRDEALAQLRKKLRERLSQVEIVPLEIAGPQDEHPWMKFAGMFQDEPLFDEVKQDIQAHRRELEAKETA